MSDRRGPALEVRRVGADEWELVRALRLDATADPDAGIAFLDSHAETLARSDEFWRARTQDAAAGETVAQFVALRDGEAAGTATVVVRATGLRGPGGRIVDDRRATVVGVYVRPAARSTGAIDALLAAAAEWVAGLGLRELRLDVHRDNLRAQAAYRRAGFTPTGETFSSALGAELVMVAPLR